MSTVFISYARENSEEAYRIVNNLSKSGVDVWFDQERLQVGQDWSKEIKRAIKKSDYVLILISQSSVNKRGYVQREIKQAIDILDEFPDYGVFVLPVRLDPCEVVNEKLQSLQWIDMFPSFDYGVNKIINTLKQYTSEEHNTDSNNTFKKVISNQSNFQSNTTKINISKNDDNNISDIAKKLLFRDIISRKNYYPYLFFGFLSLLLAMLLVGTLINLGIDLNDDTHSWYLVYTIGGSLLIMSSFYFFTTGVLRRNQSFRIKKKIIHSNSILKWDMEENHKYFYKLIYGGFHWRLLSLIISFLYFLLLVSGLILLLVIILGQFSVDKKDIESVTVGIIVCGILILPSVLVMLWKRKVWTKYEKKSGI